MANLYHDTPPAPFHLAVRAGRTPPAAGKSRSSNETDIACPMGLFRCRFLNDDNTMTVPTRFFAPAGIAEKKRWTCEYSQNIIRFDDEANIFHEGESDENA
jgi:hypothetical protein